VGPPTPVDPRRIGNTARIGDVPYLCASPAYVCARTRHREVRHDHPGPNPATRHRCWSSHMCCFLRRNYWNPSLWQHGKRSTADITTPTTLRAWPISPTNTASAAPPSTASSAAPRHGHSAHGAHVPGDTFLTSTPDQGRRRDHSRRSSAPANRRGEPADARATGPPHHRSDRPAPQHGNRRQPDLALVTPRTAAEPADHDGPTLRKRLHGLGITGTSRVAAFNELLREIPAPVLADLVGCHPRFAAERASALATDWANYAAIRARPSPAHA
jgi:hypothetical protein